MDLQELVADLYILVDSLSSKDQVSSDVFKEDDETTITIHIASIGSGAEMARPSSVVPMTANIKGEDLVMLWRNRGKN